MSNCTSIQEMAAETVDLTATRALFSVLYCLVWVGAIVGNTLVLYVITFNQVSLSVRSVFIGCLAVSDLLMSLTSLPWTAVSIFTREWIFPGLICKLIGVFQGGSIFVSSFTLTIIALDRCILIIKPNKEVIGYNRAILIVIGIWVLGYSLALPVGIYSRAVSYDNVCGVFCEEIWPDTKESGQSDHRRMYGLSVLLLQFGIPAIISSVCYWMISKVMSDQLERRRGHTLLKESEEKLVSRKTRANRMMIAMVLGFIFAWMPLNSINLYRDWSTFTNKPWFSTVFALCHVSAMTSAVLNPVIYSWFNPQFRASIKSLFHRKRSKAFHLQNTELYQSKIQTESYHSKLNTEIILSRTELKVKSDFVMHNDCHQPGDQIL